MHSMAGWWMRLCLFTCIAVVVLCLRAAGLPPVDCIGSPTDNIAFDSSNYKFTHPYTTSPSTGVGNMTLFIRQQYITDNFGNVLSLALNFMFSSGNGKLLVDGLVELGKGYSLDNDAVLEIGGEGWQWRPNSGSFVITSVDYSICSSGNTSYWSIPVVFLLTKGPRTVGTRRWVIDVSSIADNDNVSSKVETFNFTTPTIDVITEPFEGCGPDQHYIFSTKSCVSTCPCSTKPFPNFCLEGKQAFLNQTVITTVNISSNSKNKTIYTYDLQIDPNLYYQNDQTKNTELSITAQYVGVKMEGTDLLMRSHDVQPVFELFVSDSAASQEGASLTIDSLSNIDSSVLENCSYSNGSYDSLPIQVRLVGPVYQLGEHVVIVSGELMSTGTQQISIYGQLQIVVRPDTPCTNTSRKLFDLDRQECVSECACGDVAFRNTLIPYCDPVHPHRPAWLGDTQLKMEVNVGNSATTTVRVYFRPTFQILVPGTGVFDLVPKMVDTDNLVMHLRIENPRARQQDSKPQVRLLIGDELQESLNVPLNTSYLGSLDLENCSSRIGKVLSFFLLTIVANNVSVPGEFQYTVVAEFSSNNSMIEIDLRRPNRDFDVTQRFIVDLTAVSPSTTGLTISPTTSTTVSSAIPHPTGPIVPLTNQVVVTLADLTNMNFSEERQKAFKGAVAQAINEYCAHATPEQCMQRRSRKRQSTVSVQSGDVVITDIMESGSNLLVWLYVQGIAPVQAVISAIEANIDLFSAVQFTVTDVSLAATLTPTATNLFTPTATPTTLDLGVIIGVSVSIILLIILLVSVVIVCCFLKRKQCRKATEITQEPPVEEVKLDATNEQDISDRNKETTI